MKVFLYLLNDLYVVVVEGKALILGNGVCTITDAVTALLKQIKTLRDDEGVQDITVCLEPPGDMIIIRDRVYYPQPISKNARTAFFKDMQLRLPGGRI